MRIQTFLDGRPEFGVVDVRSATEWDAGHIEGATHIPLEELAGRTRELPAGVTVVAVCRTGNRSGRAMETLRALSVEAEHLEGGLTAWSELGLPLTASSGGPGIVARPGGGPEHHDHTHHDHGHAHDEHCDHDHGAGGEAVQDRLMERILGLLMAVSEHFGDREPTEEEAKAFFEELLAKEGLSPADIEDLLS